METLLSYFYSTIPQVLSGTIGLFGVFSLYKLNLIKDSLKGLAESIEFELDRGNYPEEVKSANKDDVRRLKIGAIQGNHDKMKQSLDKIHDYMKINCTSTNMYEQIILPFKNLMKARNDLIKKTTIASNDT